MRDVLTLCGGKCIEMKLSDIFHSINDFYNSIKGPIVRFQLFFRVYSCAIAHSWCGCWC